MTREAAEGVVHRVDRKQRATARLRCSLLQALAGMPT